MSTFKNQEYDSITLDTGIDLGDITAPKILYRKPSGVTGSWEATVVDTTKLRYEFTTGDLNQNGLWKFQAWGRIDGRQIWGTIYSRLVKTPIMEEVT